ncbi:alpha/beta hydrolase family protein [Alkaliphilus transvaalensis]|uniref:alpha/beta hydrolase family protein n=1 Tax=Alkaliphilus transvaalensis TaxID=114628 RepID=UPI00047918A1|nr:S9 family peptidase [Alkaliphilus transvaalensis]
MEKIALKDFTQFKFLSGLEYGPKGNVAAFVVHESDVENNKYLSNIWLLKEDQSATPLTTLQEERNFIWRQDGEHILFPSMRDEKDKEKAKKGEIFTQFYQININGGEAQKAFRIGERVTSIKEIDEETFLITVVHDPSMTDLDTLEEGEKQKELKRRKDAKDYEILDEIPFWSNGGGFTNKKRNRLCLYHVKDQRLEVLTEVLTTIHGYQLNEDKTKVVFIGNTYENKAEMDNDIYLYDLVAKQLEKLDYIPSKSHMTAHFIGENQIIYIGKTREDFGMNENPKFYLINLSKRETKCLTPEFDCSIVNSVGSDCRYGISYGETIKKDGNHLYFVTTEEEYAFLNRIDANGNIEKLSGKGGTVDTFTVKNEAILFIGLQEQKLQEIYRLENGGVNEITQFNKDFIEGKKIIKPEKLTIETDAGVNIDGWVMKPADYDENKKYPAILNIHGGPKTVYSDVYYHEMQYWANEGYFVFFCNPRGSDGKGNDFADIRGKYGTIDYEDIMKFTDAVLEKYTAIDHERVGVTGGSYGGFMTNWIIGHNHRFKAAASQRSISNWISFFGTTDIGYYFADDQIAATPWANHDKLWWHSPLKYADQVKTPTLFIHSEEDYRCWLVEGMQMFTALKYHGVPSRMCMFRGENHELSRSGKPKNRIKRLEEITNWFNQYLKGE